MSYQVIHVQKLKGSAIGGVEIHSEREREGVSHTNPDIDWSRTELNYQLHEPALHARGTYARRIDDRLREAGITRVRKDAVKLCGVVISSDREFFSQLSAEQQREFFQRSYDFMAARYGKENILSTVVHMDETTPHMHLYLVPITPDNRLCCKEIFDKRGLAALHDEFYRDVSKAYGLERGESADKGKRREHFDTQEFKAYTAAIEEKQEQLVEARQTLSNAREELHGIETAYSAQKAFVARCEAASEPSSMYPDWAKKKTHLLGGQTVTVPQEKWEALHTAVQAPEYIKQAAQELDKSIDQAKAKVQDILSQATAEKNDTIAKAQDIVRKKNHILQEAQELANNLQKQCDELQARKEHLEQELAQIEPYMESLEPLKDEVQELTKAKEILTGAVENEITQSKFYVPTKGFTSPDYYEEKARFENGKLLALYKNGEIRTVTRNIQGGYDYQILDDNRAGLCRIGWFKKEEKSTIPRSLLKELIAARDYDKPISDRLKRMIDQQNTTNRVIDKLKNRDDIER